MKRIAAKRRHIRALPLIAAVMLAVSACSSGASSRAPDVTADEAAGIAEAAAETCAEPVRYGSIQDAAENGEAGIMTLIYEILTSAAKWPSEFGIPDSASSLTVSGPIPLFSIREKKCAWDRLVYLVSCGGTIIGSVTVRLENGAIEGEYSADFSDELNRLGDTSGIVFAETIGCLCAVTGDDGIVPLRGSPDVFPDLDAYDLTNTAAPEIREYVCPVSPTPDSAISVPAVSQYSGGECYSCFLGCVAALVRAREPDAFPGLDAGKVSDDIYDRLRPFGGRYAFYMSDCAANTRHIIENVYLDQGPLIHRCADFDESMTLSGYREACDNGGIVICAAYGRSALHSVVMCGCDARPSGGIFVIVMDPLTGSHHLISWSDGRFSFNFSSVTVYMGEYLLSYY